MRKKYVFVIIAVAATIVCAAVAGLAARFVINLKEAAKERRAKIEATTPDELTYCFTLDATGERAYADEDYNYYLYDADDELVEYIRKADATELSHAPSDAEMEFCARVYLHQEVAAALPEFRLTGKTATAKGYDYEFSKFINDVQTADMYHVEFSWWTGERISWGHQDAYRYDNCEVNEEIVQATEALALASLEEQYSGENGTLLSCELTDCLLSSANIKSDEGPYYQNKEYAFRFSYTGELLSNGEEQTQEGEVWVSYYEALQKAKIKDE